MRGAFFAGDGFSGRFAGGTFSGVSFGLDGLKIGAKVSKTKDLQ